MHNSPKRLREMTLGNMGSIHIPFYSSKLCFGNKTFKHQNKDINEKICKATIHKPGEKK
jgi:hypothetical protein